MTHQHPHGRPRPTVNNTGGGSGQQTNRERALQAQLQQLQTEKAQLAAERDAIERDKESFRKRIMQQADQKLAWAAEPLIRDLLDSIDNIERAINSTPDDRTREGLLAIYREILTTLAKHNVHGIAAQGQPFNVQFHEAMGTVEDLTKPNNSVVAILRNGYTFHGRVIRPAQVQINRLPSGASLPPQPAPTMPPGSVAPGA